MKWNTDKLYFCIYLIKIEWFLLDKCCNNLADLLSPTCPSEPSFFVMWYPFIFAVRRVYLSPCLQLDALGSSAAAVRNTISIGSNDVASVASCDILDADLTSCLYQTKDNFGSVLYWCYYTNIYFKKNNNNNISFFPFVYRRHILII